MSIIRGAYGTGTKITNEYFIVGAYTETGSCYTDIIAAPTRKMAYASMRRKYGSVRIELEPTTKERYLEEMEVFNRSSRFVGRGPEPLY